MRRSPGPARLRKPVLEASVNGVICESAEQHFSELLNRLDVADFDWLRRSLDHIIEFA